MTDDIRTIQSDLAYLREVAADEGKLPWIAGANFLAGGLIYGLPLLAVWAQMNGLIDIPGPWTGQSPLWETALFVPLSILIALKAPKPKPGGAVGRSLVAGWSGVGLTTIVMVLVIFIAGDRLPVKLMWQVWTSICFALWGAAWWVVAMLRPHRGWMLVALGSLATALVNSVLINTPYELLGCAIGILVWLGGPGLLIMLRDRPRS